MDTTNNRNLFLGGGLVAVLTCLFLMSACGGPGGGGPQTDAGPMADDGGLPPPDAGMPPPDSGIPDTDAGMTPDGGMPDPDGGMACTSEMLLDRVSPPCDPDTPEGVGQGSGPTGIEGHIGPGHEWNSPMSGGSFATGTATDAMGRVGISMACPESYNEPYNGLFYFATDGNWYANWRNRLVTGVQGNHARIVFAADHRTATLEVFDGGSDVPSATVPLWET